MISLVDARCDLLSNGILSLVLLYKQDSIGDWALSRGGMKSKLVWLVFGFFGFQLYNDYNTLFELYAGNFGSHFDLHSMGQLFGRFTNAFLNFVSVYLLASATGASIIG